MHLPSIWIAAAITVCIAERDRPYIGFKVVNIAAKSSESLRRILRELPEIDALTGNHSDNSVVAIVTRDGMEDVRHVVSEEQASMDIMLHNLQEHVDGEYRKLDSRRRKREVQNPQDSVKEFLTRDEMYRFQDDVISSCTHQADVEKKTIGSSYKNKPINVVLIKGKNSTATKTIVIEAGIHAREWLSPAAANFIIFQLACNRSNIDVLNLFTWAVIPMMNPDGYHYTHTGNRFWRKNRQLNEGSSCIGTDLNRNFESGFGGADTTNDTCDNTYRGSYQYSAPESKALRDYVMSIKDTIASYISIHTFGQYILLPWAYKDGVTSDFENLMNLAKTAEKAMDLHFKIGPAFSTIYPASGVSSDFARDVARIALSYTWELMPSSKTHDEAGFAPEQSSVPEYTSITWRGLRAFVEAIVDEV